MDLSISIDVSQTKVPWKAKPQTPSIDTQVSLFHFEDKKGGWIVGRSLPIVLQ